MKRFQSLLFLFAALFAAFQVYGQQTMPLGPYGNIPLLSSNPVAVDTIALTVSQMRGLLVGTPTTAATYTTPTATALCSAFPFVGSSAAVGWNFDWWVKNTSGGSNTITLAGGTGVTLVGTGTALQNTVRHFKVTFPTGCRTNAVTLISLETSAF